ncbi:hypothetical protein [Mycobacterium intracellulare]|uniref:hypothetical protein n=1 Tax=Mycobacterium intracellulare TaxID=1767 RepID=UPI000A914326|nr:hypothetical protein [Mycobacterium intracellulare]
MARECDGPDRVLENGCRLQCRLRTADATEGPVDERVDWAGLPVNLDFAFSRDQRDKVYAQHLMRRRGAQFGPWRRGASVCVCEFATDGAESLQVT